MKFSAFLMLLTLIACDPGATQPQAETNRPGLDPTCSCIATAEWTIESTKVNFPTNFKLTLNHRTQIDTCQNPEAIKVTANANGRYLITLKELYLAEGSASAVEIVDRGQNCDNNGIFFSQENVTYTMSTITIGGVKSYSYYVTLYN